MGGNRLPLFAKRFADLRGDQSQSKYAEALGISRPTVALYETGQRIPDAATLLQICQRLEVSADYLIGLGDTSSLDMDIQAACRFLNLGENSVAFLRGLGEFGENFPGALDWILSSEHFLSTMLSLLDYHRLMREAAEAQNSGDEQTADHCRNEAHYVEYISVMSEIKNLMGELQDMQTGRYSNS